MSDDDALLGALVEDPDALDEAAWARALAVARADPERLRRQLVLDDLVARALDPTRADLLAAVRHRREHPVASARFTTAVLRSARRRRRAAVGGALAVAAAVAVAIALRAAAAPPPVPLAELDAGSCTATRGGATVALTAPAPLLPGDDLLADDGGATARYGDGTTVALAGGARVALRAAPGKRIDLASGWLDVVAAPQPAGRPLVVATDDADAVVVGTAFTLGRADGRTRLAVARGRVRLDGRDGQTIEVAAEQAAVAAPGVELRARPSPTLLFAWDGEAGPPPPDTFATVVAAPPRIGGGRCLAGRPVPGSTLVRVLLMDSPVGLFRYRAGAELSFSYWVDARVAEGISVYAWDATQQASMGSALIAPPGLAVGRWGRATVPLAAFDAGGRRLRDGDVITEITIQTGLSGGALFVDDVRVAVRP